MNNSSLFDEKTFYQKFAQDLHNCREEVIIESPYIASGRMRTLFPIFKKLLDQEVKIYVITRKPSEHKGALAIQAEAEIQRFEQIGVQVYLVPGSHHRKLAIIDRAILWEGSLNILSQVNSREIMRRIADKASADEMFAFLKYGKYI